MNFGSGGNQKAKAWRDIWGCGQGIGAVKAGIPSPTSWRGCRENTRPPRRFGRALTTRPQAAIAAEVEG